MPERASQLSGLTDLGCLRPTPGSSTTKRRPAVAVRLEPDAAAHRVHQPPRREQPDPGPARSSPPLDPDERLEDALPVLGRDARPVVGDVGADRVALPPHADAHAVADRDVLRLVLEQLLEDLLNRAGSPIAISARRRPLPADRVAAEQQPQRLDGVVDGGDRVERVAGEAGQPLAPDRGEDRVDEAVEPRDLLERRRLPLPGGRVRGGGVAEQARRTPGPPASGVRSSWVTTDIRSARAASSAVSSREAALDLGLEPALLDDPGEQRADRPQQLDVLRARTAAAPRVWTLRTPMTRSCQTSGTDSIAWSALDVEAADPARTAGRRSRPRRRSALRESATRPVIPRRTPG